MGKKYIIELEDKPVCVFDEDTQTFFPRLHRVKGFNSLVFDQNGLDKLTPYTAPDMEQVREDAFKNGYDAACKDIDIKSKINAAYRKGLEDAWEVVKKLARMDTDTSESITGYFGLHNIMHNLTASEAIEKIRQYEQEKDRQARIEYNFDEIKDVLETTAKECNVSLDEIAEVLAKMKESE